jgi:hypothetical protein
VRISPRLPMTTPVPVNVSPTAADAAPQNIATNKCFLRVRTICPPSTVGSRTDLLPRLLRPPMHLL